MKKFLFVLLILADLSICVGQGFNGVQFTPKEGKRGYYFKNNTEFVATFTTPITDVKQIAEITAEYFKKDSLFEFVQWDETAGDYTVARFSLKRGQVKANVMGVPIVRCPVIIDFSVKFQVNNGIVFMTFTDFTSKCIGWSNPTKNSEERTSEDEKKIAEEYLDAYNSSEWNDRFKQTLIGQILSSESGHIGISITSKGINVDKQIELPEGYWKSVEARKNERKDVEKKFITYNNLIKNGISMYVSYDNLEEYYKMIWKNPKQQAMIPEMIERLVANKAVLGVDKDGFRDYFEAFFVDYFGEIAMILDGKCEGVQIGEENNDAMQYTDIYVKTPSGAVLPVDSKKRKDWIKEGKSL